jgi:iron transport multicopper oxidase
MFDSPSASNNVTSWLVYDQKAPKPEAAIVQDYYDWDDLNLVPLEPLGVAPPHRYVEVTIDFQDNDQNISYAIVNNVTYSPPKVPTMFTALTSGAKAVDVAIYENNTNPFVLKHLDMVYFVINNHDTGGHPCIQIPHYIPNV